MSTQTATSTELAGFPLSPQQTRLWRAMGGIAVAGASAECVVRIEGTLDVNRLQSAVDSVCQRFEILRTTFRLLSGMTVPVQVIAECGTARLVEEDLSELTPDARGSRLQALLDGAQPRSWDLDQGPLLELRLIRLAPQNHLLRVSLAGECGDAETALGVTAAIARAYASPATPNDDGETMQYADVAQWQNDLLESDDAQSAELYWRKQLASERDPELPGLIRGDAQAAFSPRLVATRVAPDVLAAIDRLAEQEGAAASAVVLAAWQSLLMRLTSQSDMAIGLGCHGRTYDELKEALGPLARVLPLACQPEEAQPFRELVRRTQESVQEAFGWQEYFSWDRAGAGDSPAFLPMGFEWIDLPEDLVAGDVRFVFPQEEAGQPALPVRAHTERFAVKLSGLRSQYGLLLVLHFDEGVYPQWNAARVASQLQTLLAGAVANPQARLGELNLLDPEERRQILDEFSRVALEPAPLAAAGGCIHHVIAQQAQNKPDALAVVCGDSETTYDELEQASDALARRLQGLGVGPDMLVGLCCQRSADLIVGLYGILKAGGAYLPLDPSYPPQRLAFMLEDSRASVLVTQKSLVANLPACQARIVCVDDQTEVDAGGAPPVSAATSRNLAYCIYTSGSTGQPKGVLIEHRQLVQSTAARMAYYREPVRGYLLPSSAAFDSSVAGIFWTLCQGGTLILPREGWERDANELALLVATHQATHLLALPSLYSLMLSEENRSRMFSLRAVIVAGEACPSQLLGRHRQMLPEASLFNEYGPTEGTVWSTVQDCTSLPLHEPVPIGRPVPGARVYLLDKLLQPVPIGVPGELHVGGGGVAREYLHRPDLTAERFVADPFSKDPHARLYKTGDLARFRREGEIDFLGRADHQVKIRGYRIELGEIESLVRQHPAVRDAIVVAREDVPGDKRLVAYLVRNGQPMPAVGEWRKYISDKLPEYMVPQAFVSLDALPLSPNGKVDRKALPAPDHSRPELEGSFVAPRNLTERRLAKIWEEVLRLDQVGTRDDFFELGGHSLLVIDLFSRIEAQFCRKLPLDAIFKGATIQKLAALLEAPASDESSRSFVEIRPTGQKPPLFVMHSATGSSLMWKRFLPYLSPDQPVLGLLPADLNAESADTVSFARLVQAHTQQLIDYQPEGTFRVIGYSGGAPLAFELARQLEARGRKVAFLGIIDMPAPGQKSSLPQRLQDFALNGWHWLQCLLRRTPSETLRRDYQSFVSMLRRLRNRIKNRKKIQDRWDKPHLPRENSRFGRMFDEALRRYVMHRISAPLTLFRPRALPLGSIYTYDYHWGPFVGRVDVKLVSRCRHHKLVKEPYVGELAAALQRALDAIAEDQGPDSTDSADASSDMDASPAAVPVGRH